MNTEKMKTIVGNLIDAENRVTNLKMVNTFGKTSDELKSLRFDLEVARAEQWRFERELQDEQVKIVSDET